MNKDTNNKYAIDNVLAQLIFTVILKTIRRRLIVPNPHLCGRSMSALNRVYNYHEPRDNNDISSIFNIQTTPCKKKKIKIISHLRRNSLN